MEQKGHLVERIATTIIGLVSVIISLALAYQIRYSRLFGVNIPGDQRWVLELMLIVYLLTSIAIEDERHFFRRDILQEFLEVTKITAAMDMVFLVVVYLMHQPEDVARLMLAYYTIVIIPVMLVLRTLFKKYMLLVYRKSQYSSRLLVVAARENADNLLRELLQSNEWYREIVGVVFTESLNDDEKDTQVQGVPVVGDLAGLQQYVIQHEVDEVFFAEGLKGDLQQLQNLLSDIEIMGVKANVNIDAFDLIESGQKSIGRVGRYAVVTVERNILSQRELLAKRALDILGSLVGMVILMIATVFIAPAIKLTSPGPVFFGQTRIGKNGRKFTFYKFRSMYQDAEQRKKELMERNEVNGLMFKMEDDPRITKVGGFLRKTSLDELPQFWNILRGDMSLVGTRPPTVDEYEQYEAKHKCRLSMTPGLTGMWQISGRSDIKDFDEVVKLDMQYIDNWTIWKDIYIILRTVKVVLLKKGSR